MGRLFTPVRAPSHHSVVRLLALGVGVAMLAACTSAPSSPTSGQSGSTGAAPAAPKAAAPAPQPPAQPAAQAPDPAAPAAKTTAAKKGGTLNVAMQKDLVILNPLLQTSSTDQVVRDLMFEPLLALDESGKIQPRLAEKWDLGPDGRSYTFHLRRGVKFHNGQELTAEDAKFSMDYTMDAKNAAYGFETLSIVERVQAPDRYALNVQLKAASPAFLYALTDIRAFSIVPKGSLEPGTEKPASFPPGTGPFKFVEWQPKVQSTYERFDDYWGQKANLDRVVIRAVADPTVRFTALRSGDVDLIDRAPYEWVRQILDGQIKGVGYAEANTAGFRTLKFNVADPPFNNPKLRQAIAHGVDKKEILQAAYFGFGTPADQMYPKGNVWYIEGVPSVSLDLDKARALLREAGYNGEELSVLVEQGGAQEVEASTLQAQMKRIGVNMKIEVMEYASYRDRQRRGEYQTLFFGGSDQPDPSATYNPEYTCEDDPRRRAANISGYCNQSVQAWLKQVEVENDDAKRRELVKSIVTQISQDLPELYIGFVPRYWTFRERVKDFTTDSEGALMRYGGGLNYTWID